MARERFPQNEPFTIKGHWWRPKSLLRPAGDLECREGHIELRLLGALDHAIGETPFDRVPAVAEPEIIHGESADNRQITLVDSFYTAWQPGGDWFAKGPVPITSSKLTCHAILLGTHLESRSDACFKSCSIKLPNLERWLDDRPFSHNHSANGEPICHSVTYEMPPSRDIEVSESFGCIRIKHAVTLPGPWDGSIAHRSFILIEPPAPKPFGWFIEVIGQIERFFTLLFGHLVQTTTARLQPNVVSGHEEYVVLYLPRRNVEQQPLNPNDFLTLYRDVGPFFSQMLKSWLTESGEIDNALNLLFSSLREPGAFLESRFLPIVQAAEVFGNAVVDGRIADSDEFKRVRQVVVESIPADAPTQLRESIIASLAFANQPRLADRLQSLINSLDPETRKFFCNDPHDFVRGIVNTRNFFTHYTGRKKRILQGIEIHWATLKLTAMLRILLFKRLGLPEDELRTVLQNHHQLSQERRAWKMTSELGSPTVRKEQTSRTVPPNDAID